jgi:hypothetical protein
MHDVYNANLPRRVDTECPNSQRVPVIGTNSFSRPHALLAELVSPVCARLEAESPSIRAFWLLLVLVVSVLLTAPFIIIVRWWDEGIFLLGAERLLHGDRLYADFFEFLPPGSFLITAGWLAMVGTSFWSVRCLAILVIVGVSCLIYLTCRSVLKNAAASALFALAWLVVSLYQEGWLVQISHHWFTTLFSMISARAAIARTEREQRLLRGPLVAGLAAGAAAMVTPTQGVAAAFAAATAYVDVRRYRAETAIFVLGCAIVPIGLLGYLLVHGTLIDAYQDVIVFPAKRYHAVTHIRYAPEGVRANIVLAGLFPLATLLTIATLVATWRTCYRDRKFYVCIAFGIAGWVGVAPRPDFFRIIWSAPLLCPLIAYCARSLMRTWRPLYRYVPVVAVVLLCIPSAYELGQALRRALRAQVVETPRGEVTYQSHAATANQRKIVTWLTAAPAQDKFFFYPYLQMLPFLVGRTQVSRYDVFVPQYTTPAQYQEACLDVMRQASWVVIDRKWTENHIYSEVLGIHGPPPPEFVRFEKVLDEGFEPVERFGLIEIRKRRKQASEAACAGISP